jgi:hypothetical protein
MREKELRSNDLCKKILARVLLEALAMAFHLDLRFFLGWLKRTWTLRVFFILIDWGISDFNELKE